MERLAPSVCCVFFCHDGEGRILLAKRGHEARDEQGRWDCGAGALQLGESFEAAVTREVGEEYSTVPLSIEQIGVYNAIRPGSHWVAVVFAVQVAPAEVRLGEPDKATEHGWFTVNALPAPLHSQLPKGLRLLTESGVPGFSAYLAGVQ